MKNSDYIKNIIMHTLVEINMLILEYYGHINEYPIGLIFLAFGSAKLNCSI